MSQRSKPSPALRASSVVRLCCLLTLACAGLIIPTSSDNGCQTGIITAVGAEAQGVEPGDKVLFPKSAGWDVRLAGSAVKMMRRGELIARVND